MAAKKARTQPDPVKNHMMEYYNQVQSSGSYTEKGVPRNLGCESVGLPGGGSATREALMPKQKKVYSEADKGTRNKGTRQSTSKVKSTVHKIKGK